MRPWLWVPCDFAGEHATSSNRGNVGFGHRGKAQNRGSQLSTCGHRPTYLLRDDSFKLGAKSDVHKFPIGNPEGRHEQALKQTNDVAVCYHMLSRRLCASHTETLSATGVDQPVDITRKELTKPGDF